MTEASIRASRKRPFPYSAHASKPRYGTSHHYFFLHFLFLHTRIMQLCGVCSDETSKYTCPRCKIRYCSLGCYKRHKDTCLPVEQPTPTVHQAKGAVSTEPWPVEDLLNEDNITDKVPLQRLQLLGQSKELRDLLCNPHLRQLLRSIDSADSKEDAMKAAMQEPLFVEFSDQCLKIVEHEADM